MVPDKFNMVDMEGIDLIESQGVKVPGLYEKLVESIAQCRYQCLYNWKFDGILIPPTYVEMVATDESVSINGGVSVDLDDIIHIESLVIEPVLESLIATENGVYTPSEGVDGYDQVTVDVPIPAPILSVLNVTENGNYLPPSGVDGFSAVNVAVEGVVEPEPDLPNEYQRVEYLDFTPDIGLKVNLPTGYGLYTVRVSFNSFASTANTFFGYRESTSSNYDFQFRCLNGVLSTWFRDASTGISIQDPITNAALNTIYSLTGFMNVSRVNALIGKYALYSSSGVNGDSLNGKFYEIKGLNPVDLSTKCWMVPCYRKADNQPGVYDHIAQIFYYETYYVGSGYGITAGPDIN